MRKLLVSLFSLAVLAVVITACNDTGSSDNSKKDTVAKTETPATGDSTNAKGLGLVAKNGCFVCHHVSDKITGPSYMEVAARYPNNKEVIDSLSQKIMKGGSGNWGTIPMIAHPQVTEQDANIMMEYILSLKK